MCGYAICVMRQILTMGLLRESVESPRETDRSHNSAARRGIGSADCPDACTGFGRIGWFRRQRHCKFWQLRFEPGARSPRHPLQATPTRVVWSRHRLPPTLCHCRWEQAIALALQHNLGLIVSQTNVSTAGGQRLQQLQSLLPTIDGTFKIADQETNLKSAGPGYSRDSDHYRSLRLPGCACVDDLVAAEHFISAEVPRFEAQLSRHPIKPRGCSRPGDPDHR